MESKEWFAEWFDTCYYHTLYKERNDDEAALFIQNLVDFLHLEKNTKVLDLACGKGRHSVTLNKLGFEVLGVDLSENSIQLAKCHENSTLKFAVHDMRKTIEGMKFKAIFNLFTSFGYFDELSDNEKVIRSMHSMLENNGLLIIDFMNAEKVIANLVEKEIKHVDLIDFDIERLYDGQHIFKHIRFDINGEKHHYTERVQALKEKDFRDLLTQNGFTIIATFGDFTLKPFDVHLSDRLIIIARKN